MSTKSLVSQFEGLAEREGFNASVRHIKTVFRSSTASPRRRISRTLSTS